ncbi:MAG: hypothetical protein HYT79_05805 [Elusimicrobia bacterium]|nr:hypothetical protein [Elusimicrobiota bacterium]
MPTADAGDAADAQTPPESPTPEPRSIYEIICNSWTVVSAHLTAAHSGSAALINSFQTVNPEIFEVSAVGCLPEETEREQILPLVKEWPLEQKAQMTFCALETMQRNRTALGVIAGQRLGARQQGALSAAARRQRKAAEAAPADQAVDLAANIDGQGQQSQDSPEVPDPVLANTDAGSDAPRRSGRRQDGSKTKLPVFRVGTP